MNDDDRAIAVPDDLISQVQSGDEDMPEESMEDKEGKIESIFEDEPTYYNQTADQIPANPPSDPGE